MFFPVLGYVFSVLGACLCASRRVFAVLRRVFGVSPAQPWLSDPEDAPFLDPVLRKRAVKVKHVKRREKKSDKKVGPGRLDPCWESLGVTGRALRGSWWGSGGHWEILGGPGDYWESLRGPLGATGGVLVGAGGLWGLLGGSGGYWEALRVTGRATRTYWEGSWELCVGSWLALGP